MKPSVLVTGAAGFIGYHFCRRLLAEGHKVLGVDNMGDHYDVQLKRDRLKQLHDQDGPFRFMELDLKECEATAQLFVQEEIEQLAHMAVQPGVCYSLDHPEQYEGSNLVGFASVLEGCRQAEVEHFVCVSSSSVYGMADDQPFRVEQSVDHPIVPYTATKNPAS